MTQPLAGDAVAGTAGVIRTAEAITPRTTATYTKMLSDGRHEYGIVKYGVSRKEDQLIPLGVARTFEHAVSLAGAAIREATGAPS